MSFLTPACLKTLTGIDVRLAAAVQAAAVLYGSTQREFVFRVTSGYRTPDEQRRLVRSGASQTVNSYHLTGRAVDLAILDKYRANAFWDLPKYSYLNTFMQRGCLAVGLPANAVTWGGNFPTLRDGVHWQLELPPA